MNLPPEKKIAYKDKKQKLAKKAEESQLFQRNAMQRQSVPVNDRHSLKHVEISKGTEISILKYLILSELKRS